MQVFLDFVVYCAIDCLAVGSLYWRAGCRRGGAQPRVLAALHSGGGRANVHWQAGVLCVCQEHSGHWGTCESGRGFIVAPTQDNNVPPFVCAG